MCNIYATFIATHCNKAGRVYMQIHCIWGILCAERYRYTVYGAYNLIYTTVFDWRTSHNKAAATKA